MQGEAHAGRATGETGDAHYVLRVRHRNNGAVQADAGQTGAVPIVFPKATGQASFGSRSYGSAVLKSKSPRN
jgi:hypothetical protein